MTAGARDRLARLLELVPYLVAHPGARVEDVAAEFGIPEHTLLDDLQLLFVCGLPGHMPDDLIEASFEDGVIHVANADTIARPLRLGADEALTLIVGLRTLAEVPGLLPGGAGRDAVDRALAKLERAAGDAADAAGAVAVAVEDEQDVVPRVREALEAHRALHLTYYVPGRDETTERVVDPMRLLLVEGRGYLEAWCRRVHDVRLFRLDRVVALEVLDEPAAVPSQAEPRDVEAGLFQPAAEDLAVTLQLGPAARWVAEYYPCEVVRDTRAALVVLLRTPDLRWVARLVLRLGGAAVVLDPPELARAVSAEAAAALAAYAQA